MSNFNVTQQLREQQQKELAETEDKLEDAWKTDNLLTYGGNIGFVRRLNSFDTFCNLINVTTVIKEELDQHKSGEKRKSEKPPNDVNELKRDLAVLKTMKTERQAKEVVLEHFT